MPTETAINEVRTVEDIVIRMRKLFCLKGAEFSRPELQEGWEEIERLRAKVTDLSNEAYDYAEQIERLRAENEQMSKELNALEKDAEQSNKEFSRIVKIIDAQAAALEKAREALETTTVENLEKFTYIVVSEEYKSLRKEVLAAIEELKK